MKKGFFTALVLFMMITLFSCGGVNKSSLNKAVENRQVEELSEMIISYNEGGNKIEELDQVVISLFDELCQNEVYDDFVFMDSVIKHIEGTGTYDKLHDVIDDNGDKKVKSYLSGEWVRMDATALDGCVIKIKCTDESGVATITDASRIVDNVNKFKNNDLKWNNIEIIDSTSFKYDDLNKVDGIGDYCPAIATINYEENYISVHVTGNNGGYGSGDEQIWRPKAYVDSFDGKGILKEKDFIVNGADYEENENQIDSLKSDGAVFSCVWYDKEVDKSEEGVICTARGIKLGSTRESVIDVYGIGSMGMFSTKTDNYYAEIKKEGMYDSWCNVMESKSKYFIQYFSSDRDAENIRYYFDENDEVCSIAFSIEYFDENDL